MPIIFTGVTAAISSVLGAYPADILSSTFGSGYDLFTAIDPDAFGGGFFGGGGSSSSGSVSSTAASVGDGSFSIDIALANLAGSFNSLVVLVRALSYIIGLTLIVRGVMMYRIFATQTLSSAQKGEIAGPLVFLLVGSFLLYFPSTLATSLTSVFGDNNVAGSTELIAYKDLSGIQKWTAISDVVVKYMYLIGLIAFVRGWVILSKMGHSGAQPGSLGKGIIHVIGGVLLINIVETFNILATTLGYTGGK